MKVLIKKLLAKIGFTITRIGGTSSRPSVVAYISAKETVSAAEREGLSVCDYVEKLWAQQGDTQRIIEKMELHGAFATANPNIVEIGTGTGRYLEKVIHKYKPAKYESYETAGDWVEWLQSKYSAIFHKADGVTLKQTPDRSVNLVHAHGVFVCLPFFVSYGYWMEIWRITLDGGVVVFDIMSEDCLDEKIVDKWIASKLNYPCFLSKNFVVSIFDKHGFSLVSAFKNRYGAGQSEYLVFIRNKVN